jgi:multiple sugar transport system permease protein
VTDRVGRGRIDGPAVARTVRLIPTRKLTFGRAPSTGAERRRRRSAFARRRALTGFAFTLPALAFFGAVMLWPLIRSIRRAFYQDDLTTITPHYVGLRNFRTIFANDSLLHSLPTTAIFVGISTAGAFVLGLVWALVLDQGFRSRAVIRAATLVPWILPSTVSAFLWAWIFNGQYGLLNGIGRDLHLLDHNVIWLADATGAMAGVSIARIWQSCPWFVLMFLAGIQSVPRELVEAARIDGGGNRVVVRHVILPHIRFTMLVAIMLGAIGNLQLFDLIYAMTAGGPVNATSVMSLRVYQEAFKTFDLGMASALGVIWIFALAIPAAVYLRVVMPRSEGGHGA